MNARIDNKLEIIVIKLDLYRKILIREKEKRGFFRWNISKLSGKKEIEEKKAVNLLFIRMKILMILKKKSKTVTKSTKKYVLIQGICS